MPVSFALMGCGVRGAVWARVLQAHAATDLVALVDVDAARSRSLAQQLDLQVTCHTELEPARLQAEAVVLATPPALHFNQVQACLQDGLHVICEKPLVEALAPAIALVRMAVQTGKLLMVGMNFRHLAASQYLRRAVREERFGPLGFGHLHYVRNRDGRRVDLNDYPLEMEHPMLWEQSIHHLDLLRYCYGREICRLCADTWNPPGSVYRHDSCVSALLEFDDGVRASYQGTWTAGWNALEFAWRSDFREGMILQRGQFGDMVECRLKPDLGLTGPRFKDVRDAEPLHTVPLVSQQPFLDDTKGLVDEFVACLTQGTPLYTSAHDHLRSLAVIEACVQAAAAHTWVDIAQLFRTHRAEDLWIAPPAA